MAARSIPWLRVFVEGVVMVGSILHQPFRSMGFVSVIIVSVLFALGLPLVVLWGRPDAEAVTGLLSPENALATRTAQWRPIDP